ncbi:ABC transporter family protein [Tritrichomonas foetus]|uniref:ABC transporter family protein n=1 Tax=Tritrichomonas foetus TaxID=1144522 RepID=A0A1J4K9U9_9EUKA|nr:ABC transporter family protein [Tritrichomonas foetus]|eukprot:OHT08003.1 ABC transporter family protein [Tritrichomonas foetus]
MIGTITPIQNSIEFNRIQLNEMNEDLPIEPYGNDQSSSVKRPSYKKIILSLFKKQFLIKLRNRLSVIEFLLSLVFYWLLYPVYRASIERFDERRFQEIRYYDKYPIDLITFFHMPNSKLILMPDNQPMHDILNFVFRPLLMNTSTKVKFVNKFEDIKAIIDRSDSNALGVMWENSNVFTDSRKNVGINMRNHVYENPIIKIYTQSLYGEPRRDTLHLMTTYFTCLNIRNKFGNPRLYKLLNVNITAQHYPELPKVVAVDITFFFILISSIPVFLASIPDFEAILDEKEKKVTTLLFLMGCPEFCYWMVNFLTPILLCLPSCLLMSYCYTNYFYLIGTQFSLIFWITFFYSISTVNFQLFLSTFIKNQSQGKSYTITFLMGSISLSLIHDFFTLKETNPYHWIRHLFSIVPLSCYQIGMGSIYRSCRKELPPQSFTDENLIFSTKTALIWLIFDSILYFLLFLVFNAINEREFGKPLISKKNRRKLRSWMKLIFSFIPYNNSIQNDYTVIKDNFELDLISNSNLSEGHSNEDPTFANKCLIYDNNEVVYNENIVKNSNMNDSSFHRKVLEVEKLVKKYHTKLALDGADFVIYENEIIILSGSNGAGKSTLINVLSGALEKSGGKINFCHNDQQNSIKDLIGVTFQENVYFEYLTVIENLTLFSTIKNVPMSEVDLYLDEFTMNEKRDTFARDLSGGQKRKLCISIALLGHPHILLLDEPTDGVDFQSKQLIWKAISNLTNTTTIVATHDLEEVESISSRILILAHKHIPFAGKPTELRHIAHCGYILRIDLNHQNENSNLNNIYNEDELLFQRKRAVVNKVKNIIKDAKIVSDKNNNISIGIPHCKKIKELLFFIDENRKELGIKNYIFSVEHLEDIFARLVAIGNSKTISITEEEIFEN